MYKGDDNFWPKELSALARETEEPRTMKAASRVGGIALTDTCSLLFLPCSGDPAVCLPAWLLHAAMAVRSPRWTGISWWLPSMELRAGSTPSVGTLLQTDTSLSYCRKDAKCQSHDGQHWPLKGLWICQLREARRSPEGKRLLATCLLSQPRACALLMFPPLLGGQPHWLRACLGAGTGRGAWMGRTWQREGELLPCPCPGRSLLMVGLDWGGG